MADRDMDGAKAARIMYRNNEGVRMMDNLELWKKVQKTDPDYTKAFSKGGGFKGTSINPTYNNKKATEIFGLCGIGWGVDVLKEYYQEGAPIFIDKVAICKEVIHVVDIIFWYNWNGERGEVPSVGQTTFVGSNKYGCFTDEEAPKKSRTDAVTKALSMLGFSADIFLGMYDDSKYANDVKEHFKKEPDAPKPKAEPAPEQKLSAATKATNDYLAILAETDSESIVTIEAAHAYKLQKIHSGYPELSKKIKDATALKHKEAADLLNQFKEA